MRRFLVFMALAAVLLFAPSVYRHVSGLPLMFGDEAYYHARISQHVASGKLAAFDVLQNPSPYFFGPYHLLIAVASKVAGISFSSVALPVIFGLLSAAIFWMLLGRSGFSDYRRLLICSFLASSPAFITAFSQSNPNALAIFFFVLGAFLLSFRRLSGLGMAFLASTVFLGFFSALLLVVAVICFSASGYRKRMLLLFLFSLAFAGSVAYYALAASPVLPGGLVSLLVSDLGGSGFGFFVLLLAAVGFIFSWGEKFRYAPAYCLFLFLLSASLFMGSFVFGYLAFAVAFFAGEGLFRTLHYKWQVPVIRQLTLAILLCGVLFSTLSFVAGLSHSGPDPALVEGLSWLGEQPSGVVLSDYSNGFWIGYFADKPAVLDSFSIRSLPRRYSDAQEMFYSRNIAVTRKLLDSYNIRYILIDPGMLSGRVWKRPDEGLLFVFRNRESFRLAYNSTGIQVWEYKQDIIFKDRGK